MLESDSSFHGLPGYGTTGSIEIGIRFGEGLVPYPFPPDIELRIRAQIESGQFATEDDVLREAIDTLEKRQRGLCELRNKVREADADIAYGRVGPFDANEAKSAVRKRLAQHRITS
jgi:Arc/MetJ-type ribon-helix-helix transcriptional regulator